MQGFGAKFRVLGCLLQADPAAAMRHAQLSSAVAVSQVA